MLSSESASALTQEPLTVAGFCRTPAFPFCTGAFNS